MSTSSSGWPSPRAVRRRLRAAPDHLPDDRLPQQRVPRPRGGERFEPEEANPMIGYRGALRYTHEPDLLELELEAVDRVWDEGHTNVHLMLPFVRTPREVAFCREQIERIGLLDRPRVRALGDGRGPLGPLPPRALCAPRDRRHLDRLQRPHPAPPRRRPRLRAGGRGLRRARSCRHRVHRAADRRARGLGLQTSICGQAPSVYPEYAELLVGRASTRSLSTSMPSSGHAA